MSTQTNSLATATSTQAMAIPTQKRRWIWNFPGTGKTIFRMEEVISSPTVVGPAHLRRSLGLLKSKIDQDLTSLVSKVKYNIENVACFSSLGITLSSATWFAISNFKIFKMASNDFTDIFFLVGFSISFLLCILMAFAGLTTASLALVSKIRFFRITKEISSCGWEAGILDACSRMSALGMSLPEPLLALVPHLENREASVNIMKHLGEDDSMAMFVLEETLNNIAVKAQSAQKSLLPVRPLVLRGESAELLDRVGSALGLDESIESEPAFLA